MQEIPIGQAIGHLKAVATPTRAGTHVIKRLGAHQQWMGLDEAVSLIRLAGRCFLRDDTAMFPLVLKWGGESFSFQVDPKETL
jgi:hypothetical protein